jgi:molybdenum cofactor cytidylyltransferase
LTRIAAIVLAAGRSSRFGHGNKLLARIDDVPLVRRVLNAVEASAVSEVLLVVAPTAHDVVAGAGTGRWRTIVNSDADKGLASSLRAGISALPATTDGALVVLADMPGVTTDLIARVMAAFTAAGSGVIVFPADATGRQGHPVLWPKHVFHELLVLEGDTGGKGLLQKHKAISRSVAVSGTEAFFDIDTQADLARLKGERST